MIKKHLLTKQKGIDSCSLLPQKWLVCLLTLLATLVGSGRMWADDDVVWTLDFKTASSSLTDSSIGATALGGNFTVNSTPCDFINFPDKIALPSTMGGQTGTSWRLAKNSGLRNGASGERILGVNDCKAGQILTITHTATAINLSKVFNLKKIDESSTDTKTVFKVLNNGAVGFNVYKTETGVYPTIETMSLVTPDYTVTYSVTNDPGDAAFSVINISNGNAVVASGSTVKAGDELEITAHEDDNGKYLKEWLVNGVSDKTNIPAPSVSIWHNKISFNRQIAENTDIQAVYAPCFTVDVQDLNGGTAVWRADGFAENLNSGSGMREGSNVTVTLTPPSGKILNKWTLKLMNGDTEVYSNDNYSNANPLNLSMNYTQFASRTGEGYKFVLKPVYATGNIVTYELDGGACAVTREITESSVTLPTPTKAGYSFIGWRTATTKIVPDAGVAGQTYTPTGNVTLYALWYKNNCEIDFTSSGPLNGTPDKTGAAISDDGVFMAGGTPVGNITINGNAINTRFGVQTGTSWQYRNGGLYSNNSGKRAYGINGCLEGEYITINSSVDPNVNADDAELVSNVGNTYIYKVKKDGAVKFTPVRYSVLYSVAVASPCPHTIWNGTQVGPADNTAPFWNHFSKFYKLSKENTVNFKFINHGGNTSFKNWLLVAQTISKHNGDLGVTNASAEKLVLRADGHCWAEAGTSQPSSANFIDNSQFITDMNDAEVEVSVEFNAGGYLVVTTKATAKGTDGYNGATYQFTNTTKTFSEQELYLALTVEGAHLTGLSHPIKFANTTPTITTSANGTAVYEQHAVGNPEGTWVEYSIVGEPTGGLEASISQISGSPDYTLSVKGKGTVTIKGTCGGNSDTYTLTVDGLIFQEPTPVYTKNAEKKYEAVLVTDNHSNVTYKLNKFDTTEGLRDVTITETSNGCSVTGIPDDKGGIIVVRAERTEGGNTSVAEFCLTVPYDLHVWDMYHDPLNYGSIVEGNATDAFTGNDNQNEKHRVGSAHYVIYNAGNSYTYNKTVDGVDESVTDGNRVAYNNWMDGQDYYAKENWYNEQTGTQTCNVEGGKKDYDVLHKYWRFTYKTCSYKDGVRTYVNEPLFAYKNPVIGDNGRIIKETAGLIFNSSALRFGVSDNDTKNGEGGTTAVREQDRCVLMQVGSSMTIPHVKKDRYVRIHWYRHSDNNGDRCTITNGIDLDGNKIDPTHVIRFTGSHYYDDHKGSFVFKVGGGSPNTDGTYDVTISAVGIGWTEIYRVEVMEKFDSELQLAEVDVANKITADQVVGKRTSADIGKPYATIDEWNSKDLNNVDNYNRLVFDEENANHPVLASRLVSKIRTKAKADAEGGNINTPVELEPGKLAYAPELYISGYPGHCFTWNGWMNTTLQAEFNGSARCKVETKRDTDDKYTNWSQEKTIPADHVWVGNNIKYTMHPLKEVMGEGTIKLTLRTHSGKEGEPHYTFDKREAIVAVGQYSVQEYPYTWDFTNYNFGLDNKYGSKTFDAMKKDAVNKTKEYGHWQKNSDYEWSMHAYQTKISSSMGGHTVKDDKQLNKPYFAQGSQLALGTVDDKHTILETEGLRVTIPALTTGKDLVKLVASDVATDTDRGYMTICSGGTITIPEVPEGMYVFVKSSTAPTSATHTTGSDVAFASNNDGNVTYYKATGDDVTLTFNSGATLYKIGVTDQVKDINAYGYSTESRKYDIDHNETRYFSANVSAYYVGKYSKSSSTVGETKVKDDAYIPKFTGVLLHDDMAGTKREAYKIPLFVPACNITEDNTAEGNCMKPTTTEGHTTSDMSVPAVDGDYTNYTLTNLYGKVQNSTVPTYGSDHTIGFYKFYGGSMTQNKSYLHLPTSGLSETSKVKGFIFLPGSEMDDEESTPIKTVEVDIDDDAEYFTVNGLKLNGAPTKSGVYIKNGQKVYVK